MLDNALGLKRLWCYAVGCDFRFSHRLMVGHRLLDAWRCRRCLSEALSSVYERGVHERPPVRMGHYE